VGTITDISVRRAAEDALRRSETLYRTIVETTGEGVWQIDTEGYTTFVNARMAGMLGQTVESMKGRSFLEFMPDESRPQAMGLLSRRHAGVVEQHEFTLIGGGGAPLHVLVQTTPIFDESGLVSGLLAMMSDITARKQAEWSGASRPELSWSEASVRRLVGRLTASCGCFDALGRVHAASPTFAALMGRREGELIGMHGADLVDSSSRAAFESALVRMHAEGQSEVECRAHRRDAREVYLNLTLVRSEDAAGRYEGYCCCAADITARKQVERRMAEAERLARGVLDALASRVVVVDRHATIIAANRAWTALVSERSADPARAGVGANYLEVCARADGEDRELACEVAAGVREVLAGGVAAFERVYSCLVDGRTLRYRVRVTRLPGEAEPAAVVSHEDIS
jgi:PAS domain S-box-containing protein